MSEWVWIPAALVIYVAGCAVAWCWGWYVGVRETEARWSEAVARKEAHDEWRPYT